MFDVVAPSGSATETLTVNADRAGAVAGARLDGRQPRSRLDAVTYGDSSRDQTQLIPLNLKGGDHH